MPLYEYQCDACGQRFEVIQKFSDGPVETCAKCGKGPVVRLMSSPAIQFKGSGWYVTDYAQKGRSGGGSTGESKDNASDKTQSTSESTSDKPSTDSSTKSDSSTSSSPSSEKS